MLCTPIVFEWILSALFVFIGLQVHSKNFGVDLRCTQKALEWTLGALQIFGVNFECMIVYSKEVKYFGVERCSLQIYWSEQLPTPTELECTLFSLHKFGVHEVKSWIALSRP
jgi:hypothetical protein